MFLPLTRTCSSMSSRGGRLLAVAVVADAGCPSISTEPVPWTVTCDTHTHTHTHTGCFHASEPEILMRALARVRVCRFEEALTYDST